MGGRKSVFEHISMHHSNKVLASAGGQIEHSVSGWNLIMSCLALMCPEVQWGHTRLPEMPYMADWLQVAAIREWANAKNKLK